MSTTLEDESDDDPEVLDAFDRWREAFVKGEPVDVDALTARLSKTQRDAFDELVADEIEVFADLRAAFGSKGGSLVHASPEPTGNAGRYINLCFHNSGGMGTIYRAWDVELSREVAYKVMHDSSDLEAFRRRFEHEATITAMLRYPGIVPVYGMVTDDAARRPAYAMDFIDGHDLQESKIDGWAAGVSDPIEIRKRVEIVRDVCRIVGYAHARGIFHGDLSPKNIMIDQAGATYVIDWGLAREVGSASFGESGLEPCTPHYASTSARRGVKTIQADVYSLGATLAALVLGVDGENRPRVDGRSRRNLPGPLRDLIKAALADDDKGIYPHAGAMAEDIDAYLKGERVQARRDRPHEWAWRVIRHHPTVATAVFSAILLIAVAGFATERISANAANHQAERETERRQVSERKRHDDQVIAARTAARRGAWNEAMALYRQAIKDHQIDEIKLRAERLFGYFATNDEAGLAAEIAALDQRRDLGRYATHLDLVRGARLMDHTSGVDQGRAIILRALKSRDDLLSEADILFAQALVETRPLAMIALLRQALKADALHYPARSNLIVALITTGQPDEVLDQADQMAGLFPDSNVPAFGRLVVATLKGDRPAMQASLDLLAQRVGGDFAPLRDYCVELANLLDIVTESENSLVKLVPDSTLNPVVNIKIMILSTRLRHRAVNAAKPFAFAVPSVHLLFRTYEEIIAIGREDLQDLDRLEALSRKNPEALIQSLIVAIKLNHAYDLVRANRPKEARAAMADLADRAYAAADAPTILFRSPIRYQTRLIGMVADVAVLKFDPTDDPRRVRRLRDNIQRLVDDGRVWTKSRRECIRFLVQMITSSLTEELASAWNRDKPEGAEAFRKRGLRFAGLGRMLIEDWVDEEPENRDARRLLGEVDDWAARFKAPAAQPINGL